VLHLSPRCTGFLTTSGSFIADSSPLVKVYGGRAVERILKSRSPPIIAPGCSPLYMAPGRLTSRTSTTDALDWEIAGPAASGEIGLSDRGSGDSGASMAGIRCVSAAMRLFSRW
jgi:hypothetical protein